MKTSQRIFLGLFILGFILKVFHIPGAAMLLTLSASTLTVLTMIRYVKSLLAKDTSDIKRLFELGLVLWLDYFLTRIQYWGIGTYLIYLCFLVSMYLIIRFISNKETFSIKTISLVLLFIGGVFMTHVHSYSIYRLINMNTLITSDISANNYDRYSYFLFIGGQENDAIIAGEQAIEKSIKESGDNSGLTQEYKDKLEKRKSGNFVY